MRLFKIFTAAALFTAFVSCNAQSANTDISGQSTDKIEAYYFHFTARCVTCKTIEAQFKENVEKLYPNQIKSGLMTFRSVNIEETENKALAEKLGVSGQTLLIVKGNNKINLTNEGFMYAVVKPEKFKEIINEKIDGLLIR